ncbi:MAG: outer membrane beta-barrel protein [Betaproteobacteria bacterium]|nr:outer membrane beta-barrel protein [Betaproteobacteria bacterium]MDE2049295.1 outer membrane beta-barrel protein [Betaproteobacteria bacterium]
MKALSFCPRRHNLRRAAVLLALSAGCTAGFAQDGGGRLNQRFWIQLGAFDPRIDSIVQANDAAAGLTGSRIDGESDLGLSSRKTVGLLQLGARLDDRWRLEFEYFALKRSANQTLLNGNLVFDNATYPVAATLASQFDSSVYRLSGGYSFFRNPQAELGVAVGLHVTDFKVMLDGAATVNGLQVASARKEKSKALPLPTVGLYCTYAFAPNWLGAVRADYFSLRHSGYKGTLTNLQADLLYRFTPNFSVGLGYRLDDYRLNANSAAWNGSVQYKFRGPQVVFDLGF